MRRAVTSTTATTRCGPWLGRTPESEPALALSVTSQAARTFEHRGPGQVLARLVAAIVAAGGGPGLRLGDWLGHAVLIDPDLDPELAAVALEEAHPPPARVSLAQYNHGVLVAAAALALAPAPAAAATPLTELAARAGVPSRRGGTRPRRRGWSPPRPPSTVAPELVVRMARAPVVPPQVDDEPDEIACGPRLTTTRFHAGAKARRLLRRLFGMKKIGPVRHTAFDALYRGVPGR